MSDLGTVADTIHKLQAENDRAIKVGQEWWNKALLLEAERDRLREALEKIAVRTAGETRFIAKAALAKEV